MQLSHIISKLFYQPALLTPARHAALCLMLDARLAGAAMVDAVQKEVPDLSPDETDTQGDVAIIPVHGTIVAHPEDIAMSECGCALEDLNAAIATAEQDSNIHTVIYDFRSPGGTVTGVPETARRILASRKRTIGYTGSECCSAALWLASQCEMFYSTESASVGSVGVYTMCLDMTRAMKREGIKVNAIHAGKYKMLGAYWRELSDGERDILQKNVDKIYANFKIAMESRRVVQDEHFGNGLVFDGEQAVEAGFTDGMVDGIEEVLEIASSNPGK